MSKLDFKKYTSLLKVGLGGLVLSPTLALAIEPAPASLGPVDFIPSLKVGVDSDSNIYLTSENEESSLIYTVRPDLLFKAQDQLNVYSARIYANSGTYSDGLEGDDDYVESGLLFDAHLEFNDKNRLDLLAHLANLHEARGSGFSTGQAGSIKEVDMHTNTTLGGVYELGIGNTNTGFDIGYTAFDREYDKNPAVDSNGNLVDTTKTRNYDSGKIDLGFFYQVMPNTKLFIDISNEDINYKTDVNRDLNYDGDDNPNTNPQDIVKTINSTETYIYIGASWSATANTVGTVKLGQYDKDYADKLLTDLSGEAAWDIQVDWTPLEHSKFSFSTGSYVAENEGSSTARITQDYQASWNQAWLENFSTNVNLLMLEEEHTGTQVTLGTLREDTTSFVTVSGIYSFRRWMDFTLAYKMDNRTSTIDGSGTLPNYEYDKNLITLSVNMSL